MLKIICPECLSDNIAYTATLENADDFTETFLCKECGEKTRQLGGAKMLKIICPECLSDNIAYTATLENADDFTETFLCKECGEDFSEGRIYFEKIVK